MFGNTEDWCQIWSNTHLCFQKWHGEFHRLKNIDFILESKMAELNQKEKIQDNQIKQMQCENVISP